MKRHLTLASTNRLAADVLPTGFEGPGAGPRPADAAPWRHTLILQGRLDGRSSSELEDELECLYQEGVTYVSLDLRRLEAVETGMVGRLVSLAGRAREHGHELAVIPGPPLPASALAEAGATHLVRREQHSARGLSTTTVKELPPPLREDAPPALWRQPS
jgi:anti-anti-sigma regulatory factor